MYAFCFLPAVPMRAEPSHRSEMVNQLLFGDNVELLTEQPGWLHVRSLFDGYQGWVCSKQLVILERPFPTSCTITDNCRILMPAAAGFFPSDLSLTLTVGATCPETWLMQPLPPQPLTPLHAAMQLLGTPYLWGGRTPFGIDCSGLVQVAHKACGVMLPRDASQQVRCGTPVAFEELQSGDLAFFEEGESIVHVGICMGEGHILHASGQVRIDPLARDGIHDTATGQLSHRLHSIRHLR